MTGGEKKYTQMDLDRAYYSAYNQAYERARYEKADRRQAEEDRVIERLILEKWSYIPWLADNIKDITLSIPRTFARDERNVSDEILDLYLDSDKYSEEQKKKDRELALIICYHLIPEDIQLWLSKVNQYHKERMNIED